MGTRPLCCTPEFPLRLNASNSYCLQAETQCSHSHSMSRYSHSHTTHRHSHSHCCSTDTPHDVIGKSTFFKRGGTNNNSPSLSHSFSLSYYASAFIALNALTLSAFTIFPRKASRDPMTAPAFDESLLAVAYDTPPLACAL